MKSGWKLHAMGCRGSWPVCGREYLEFGGSTSCYIIKREDYAIVIDCGSGLYRAAGLLGDCSRIDVLLTHLHYDHLLGLLNWGVFPKTARLRFFAQFGNWMGEETLAHFICPPFWPYTPRMGEMVSVDSPGEAGLSGGVHVRFHPSSHPDGASILRLNLGETSLCAAFDYEHNAPFPLFMAEGCGLLLYDAMYTKEEYAVYAGRGHSCWQEGVAVAERSGAGRLLATHHAPERGDEALRMMEKEMQAVMPSARFVREGDVYDL